MKIHLLVKLDETTGTICRTYAQWGIYSQHNFCTECGEDFTAVYSVPCALPKKCTNCLIDSEHPEWRQTCQA